MLDACEVFLKSRRGGDYLFPVGIRVMEAEVAEVQAVSIGIEVLWVAWDLDIRKPETGAFLARLLELLS
jgi:hypothetical protein